jgi:hypothetical protein
MKIHRIDRMGKQDGQDGEMMLNEATPTTEAFPGSAGVPACMSA